MLKLDLTFNNGKPKDWRFVLDLVTFRTGLGYNNNNNNNNNNRRFYCLSDRGLYRPFFTGSLVPKYCSAMIKSKRRI